MSLIFLDDKFGSGRSGCTKGVGFECSGGLGGLGLTDDGREGREGFGGLE